MNIPDPTHVTSRADLPNIRGVWPKSRVSTEFDLGANWPRISLVTPSFGQASFLEKTIRSVLLQQYPNLQYIIIDGGSKDGSEEIIKRYSPWLDYWVSESDEGQTDAINKGLRQADGEILGWLNSDDILLPDALFSIAKGFREMPEALAVVGRGHKVDVYGHRVSSPWPERIIKDTLLAWMEGGNFMQPGCFFSRYAWELCGPLNTQREYCMDLELWLRIAEKGPLTRIEVDVAHALEHPFAKTTAERGAVLVETAGMLREYGGDLEADRALKKLAGEYDSLRARGNRFRARPISIIFKKIVSVLIRTLFRK